MTHINSRENIPHACLTENGLRGLTDDALTIRDLIDLRNVVLSAQQMICFDVDQSGTIDDQDVVMLSHRMSAWSMSLEQRMPS